MVGEAKEVPHLSLAGIAAAARREARLATALRANLTRRKAQARQRAAGNAEADVRAEQAAGCAAEEN